MSGHSKWSTIKRAKGAADAKRGVQFSKLSRAITVAAKQGGTDPAGNLRLKMAVESARAASMPKDTIARAIEKASGSGSEAIEELVYEGYGPGGAALLIEVMTDNRNRSLAEVRTILNKNGGSMGDSGSVAWMFKSQAIIELPAGDYDVDEVSMAAIEAGANDLDANEDGGLTILADVDAASGVVEALAQYGQAQMSATQLIPNSPLELEAEDQEKLERLVELLEEYDDVASVASNAL